MSTDIYINLDCGAELQITKIGDRFQVLEIVADSDGWRKQKARVIGRLHNTINWRSERSPQLCFSTI